MTTLVTAEFRKVLGLRYWWILGIAPLVVGLFGGAFTLLVTRPVEEFVGAGFAGAVSATIGMSIALAFVFLFAAIFGAVYTSAEFQHRTIITTFLTSRGRDGVLAAKFAVATVFGLLYCVVVELVAILAIFMFVGDPGDGTFAALAVLVVGLGCAALWALIGAGLGLSTGSTAGSVVALCTWVPVGELVVSMILHTIGLGAFSPFLPVQATWYTLLTVVSLPDDMDTALAWPLAPLVLIVWTTLFCGLGWWRTRTRDIV